MWSPQLRAEIHCKADVDVALLLPAQGAELLFIMTTRCFYPLQGSLIPNLLGLLLVVENLPSKTQSKRKKRAKYTRTMFYLSFIKNTLNNHQCPSAQLCLSVQFLKPDSLCREDLLRICQILLAFTIKREFLSFGPTRSSRSIHFGGSDSFGN